VLIVTATPDLPGEPKGTSVVIEPGAKYHGATTFDTPKVVTIDAAGDGKVIVTVADPPAPVQPVTP